MLTITVDRTELANAAAWAKNALPRRIPVPILAGIRCEVTETGTLNLAAFDYDWCYRADVSPVAGTDTSRGAMLVTGADMIAAIRALPKGTKRAPVSVTLAETETGLTMTCQGITSGLPALPIDDYPALPDMPAVVCLADGPEWAGAAMRVFSAAGTDDTLPVLTTVRMTLAGDCCSLAATDRYRLHCETLPAMTEADVLTVVMAPRVIVKNVAKIAAKTADVVFCHQPQIAAENLADTRHESAGFAVGGYSVTFRPLEGQYPRVERLTADFGAKVTDTIMVDSARLQAAVNRAAAGLARAGDGVDLQCGPDTITVTATRDGAETYREVIPAAGTPGFVVRARFNPAYLADALAGIAGDVRMGIGGNGGAVLFAPAETVGTYHALVMQIRISDATAETYRAPVSETEPTGTETASETVPAETETVPECTPEQGEQWARDHGDGYSYGRYDGRYGRPARDGALISVPADRPYETGAQYITRHLGDAWRIGYTRAYEYETARRTETVPVPAETASA